MSLPSMYRDMVLQGYERVRLTQGRLRVPNLINAKKRRQMHVLEQSVGH